MIGHSKKIIFFGDYNPDLLRIKILTQGFHENGIDVQHCNVSKMNLGNRGIIRNLVLGSIGLIRNILRNRLYKEKIFLIPEARLQFFPLLFAIKLINKSHIIIDVYDFLIYKVEYRLRFSFFQHIISSAIIKYEQFCFKHADLLFVESDGCSDLIARKMKIKTDIVIWPVWSYRKTDETIELTGDLFDADNFNVIFWGNFHFHHGIRTIINAAEILSKEDPNVMIYLVGSDKAGKVNSYKADVERLNLDNVIFTGRKSEEQLNAMIQRSDVCLGIFSSGEKAMISITNKVFESLSMGKATITARSPVMSSYFVDGKNIVLVDPESPKDLARKILLLKNDAVLRDNIGREAKAFFWSDYRPAEKARDVISSVLKE